MAGTQTLGCHLPLQDTQQEAELGAEAAFDPGTSTGPTVAGLGTHVALSHTFFTRRKCWSQDFWHLYSEQTFWVRAACLGGLSRSKPSVPEPWPRLPSPCTLLPSQGVWPQPPGVGPMEAKPPSTSAGHIPY